MAVVLFKRIEGVSPMAINLFKNTFASVLLLLTMLVFQIGFDGDRPSSDWRDLIISGVIGIAIADTLYLHALRRVGASTVAVIECAYAPTIVTLAIIFLDEPMTGAFLMGAMLVVTGLLVAVWPSKMRAHVPVSGLLFGFAAMALMAVGVTLAKRPLNVGNLVEVTTVRLLAGLAGQLIWIALVPGQRKALAVLRPSPAWRQLIPAALFATYIAMLLWLGGLKYTTVSTASVLNQLSVGFTLLLAWAWLKEPISRRKLVGAGLSLAGALLVIIPIDEPTPPPVAEVGSKALEYAPDYPETS